MFLCTINIPDYTVGNSVRDFLYLQYNTSPFTASKQYLLLAKYYTVDKIKNYESTGHVARMGDRRVSYRVLIGRHKRKNHLETYVYTVL
jgi:hypothetical protein